jgi:hypothetical protein
LCVVPPEAKNRSPRPEAKINTVGALLKTVLVAVLVNFSECMVT